MVLISYRVFILCVSESNLVHIHYVFLMIELGKSVFIYLRNSPPLINSNGEKFSKFLFKMNKSRQMSACPLSGVLLLQTEQSEPASGESDHLARPFCVRPHPRKIREGVKDDICSSTAHRRQNPGLRLLHTIFSNYMLLFRMIGTSVYPIIAAAVFLENSGVFSTWRSTWGGLGSLSWGNWIVHHGGLGPLTVISSFHQIGVNHHQHSWSQFNLRFQISCHDILTYNDGKYPTVMN